VKEGEGRGEERMRKMAERYKKTTTLSLTSLLHLYPSLFLSLRVYARGGEGGK
jgi:hypothetical protein